VQLSDGLQTVATKDSKYNHEGTKDDEAHEEEFL
jgi:hypothetical protein